jgi:nicotinamide-nucleotide amidase
VDLIARLGKLSSTLVIRMASYFPQCDYRVLMEEGIDHVGKILLSRNETIAVAESVTSGLLQAALSSASNASMFFQGGITAYNLGQKTKHLNVEPIHALLCNSVSEKVANELAMGACALFNSDWGIGITGYAATLPEKDVYDLYAFYSFCFRGQILHSKKIVADKKEPEEVQHFYVTMLLQDLEEKLNDKQFK